ncbi:DUF3549 family protein [Thalassotalea atypica]|uniref:DUF3549 family protein n=1 Tax=Thalassotalea atypica TaxID=2054316 RepID=UPI0025735A5F|nr:DUF3549 family protein [Thalassotalea atypica]
MTTIATISELLTLSNAQYRVFDIGRKITKISKDQFNKIELNQIPYPFPAQGNAWVALAFWQKQNTEPYLWFVKLPLDERGLMNQGARNHFIAIIVEALGSDLSVDPTEKQEELLKSNPYHFTPAGYKLSALNSILKAELKQAASIHFESVQQYMSGHKHWQEWQHLGLQGLQDYAARVSHNDNTNHLIKALPNLPSQVLFPLCIALENQILGHELINAFIAEINSCTDQDKTLHLVRALSSSIHLNQVKNLFRTILERGNLSPDWLITMATRCWEIFEDKELVSLFLELLAKEDDKALFPAIFKDLVAIPTIKPNIFVCMRSETRSDALAKAIGSLFNQQ